MPIPSSTGNYVLDVKRIFLSFAQQYFANQTHYPTYLWQADLRDTPIIIVDKNAVDLEVIEKRPSIVLSRGSMGWMYTSIGQKAFGNRLGSPETDMHTDLVRGSLTYNCIAKYGIQAEEIANILFQALTQFKLNFRAEGVHKVFGLVIGEEQVLKGKSEQELALVPLVVQYAMQRSLRGAYDYCTLVVNLGDDYAYQGSQWYYRNDVVYFFVAPDDGTEITFTYTDSITLGSVTETATGDGSTTEFTLSNTPLCTYPMVEDFIVSGTGWTTVSGYDA